MVSWEEAEDAAAMLLRMYGADKYTSIAGSGGGGDGAGGLSWPPASARPAFQHFWASVTETFPRFDHLKDVLTYQYDGKHCFRGILFVQQVSSRVDLVHRSARHHTARHILTQHCTARHRTPPTTWS